MPYLPLDVYLCASFRIAVILQMYLPQACRLSPRGFHTDRSKPCVLASLQQQRREKLDETPIASP